MKNNKDYTGNQYKYLSSQAYEWFMSSKGAELRRIEYKLIECTLQRLNGLTACLTGFSEQSSFTLKSNQRVFLLGSLQASNAPVRSDIHFWPVKSKSMDVVLLHHSLEWSQQPQRILREACRVLAPGGEIVVVGFNPLSLLSVSRFFSSYYPKALRQARLYSVSVVNEWLNTLGFSCESVHFSLRAAPLRYASPEGDFSLQKGIFGQLPIGGIFVLVAIKEQCGLIMNEDAWKQESKSLVRASYACNARQKAGKYGL